MTRENACPPSHVSDDGVEDPDQLYEAVCALGHALAEAARIELPDEWANLCADWLRKHRPEVLERGVTEDEVRAAFAAWEIGGWR